VSKAIQVISEPTIPAWQGELARTIRSPEHLARVLPLLDDEKRGLAAWATTGGLPLAITPAYLDLIDPNDPEDPLRRQVIPRASEYEPDAHALADPLGEKDHEKRPHLIHRYPDRVLFLVTDRCAAYSWTGC
jgi:lysine 2,3-aminomutase